MNHGIFESFLWVFVANYVYRTQRSNQTIYSIKPFEGKEQESSLESIKVPEVKADPVVVKSWQPSTQQWMKQRNEFSSRKRRLGVKAREGTADSAVSTDQIPFFSRSISRVGGGCIFVIADSAVKAYQNPFFSEATADSAEVAHSRTPARWFPSSVVRRVLFLFSIKP